MRAAIFGAPSPLTLRTPARSPYALFANTWMRALAALVLVAGAGTGTAFASQGALPGQPLYAIKTKVVEPVELALASSAAAKASVHAQIAQARVAEAEALAQKGSLDANTGVMLADDFESHAQSAVALANEASSTDPAESVQIKAQVAVSSSVGGTILAALAEREGADRDHAGSALATRVLAIASNDDSRSNRGRDNGEQKPDSAAPKASAVRTMAAMTATSEDGSTSAPAIRAASTLTAAVNLDEQRAALGLAGKAQDAVTILKAQFANASSTLDATTTVSIETQLSGIDALLMSGQQSLNDSIFDTAINDYTQALSRALRLTALLSAQQQVDHKLIDALIKNDSNRTDGIDSSTDSVRVDVGH